MTQTTISPAGRQAALARTGAYYTAFIALGLVMSSLGPTLPGLAQNVGVPLGQISLLFTARSLGALIGSSSISGWLYDHRPGNPVLAVTLLTMGLLMAGVPLAGWLPVLILLMFGLGLAEATLDVGGNTLLMWTHGEKVGPFMNGLHFFFGVGAFLAPIVVAQMLLLTNDIRGAYWLLALFLLPVALVIGRLPSPAGVATSTADEGVPARPGSVRLVFLVALFFLLYVGAEVSFGGWVYSYALALELGTAASAAYLTSAFWGALTVGRLLSIPIAGHFRPRTILLVDLLGCLASLGLILSRPGSVAALWVGTAGLGLFMASVFPTTLAFAERRMTITGRVTGRFFIGASLGGMSLPWLAGQLFERVGPQATTWAILANLLVACVVFVLIMTAARH